MCEKENLSLSKTSQKIISGSLNLLLPLLPVFVEEQEGSWGGGGWPLLDIGRLFVVLTDQIQQSFFITLLLCCCALNK
jgi:hypothetical protein